MTLKTWSFSKKKNSTAVPTGQSRDYSVYMKENTSIENPVFILGTGITADISYCQWNGNYYFIDDIVLISADQVELHCSIDVLATHKTAIGAYTAFVERAASTHDAYIKDSALTSSNDIVSETIATTDIFGASQTGCYIVRVVSPSDSSPSGVASFVMSPSEVEDFLDFITTDNNFNDVLQDAIVKSFFNPFQYVLSIMWFPKTRNDVPGSDETLRLGWWNAGTYRMLSTSGYYDNVSVNLPTSYYSSDFRVMDKEFTELQAFIPGLGIVDLDPAFLTKNTYAEVSIDYVTGQMNLTFYERGSQAGVTVNKDPFGSFSCQLGVPIQIGQWSGMGASTIAGAEASPVNPSILSSVGQGLVAGLSDIMSGVGGLVQGITRTGGANQNVLGSAGNKNALIAHPRLVLYQRAYGCGDFPNTVYGRPLYRNRLISTLSGFIKCAGASVPLAAPDTEIEKVNSYLNGGFYYE